MKEEKEEAIEKVNNDSKDFENKEKAEKQEVVQNEKEPKKGLKKAIIIICIILVIMFLSTIFAILNIGNPNIIKGVYIENVDLSNMERETVEKYIVDKVNNIQEIKFIYGEYNTTVSLEDLGIKIDGKDAVQKAIKIGKTNNIIIDNFQILKSFFFKTNIPLDYVFDEEKINENIKNIQAEIPDTVKEYSYDIEDDKLIITNGKTGNQIEKDKLKELLIKNIIDQFNENKKEVQIPMKLVNPEKINIEKIYSEIHKEASDAYINEDPFELHKDEDGVDFDISIEEAKEIINKEEKDTYSIPLKITKAKVTVKDLGDRLFKQTLSKYTTIYDAGNTNRASNIALAAKTINETILLPGETFSYNKKLGNTTKEKGYKEGGAYVNGKVVQAYGGGICQVSTTLYNAVLYANLEIVERHNHSYAVNYVPAGRDATVAYGGKDFKFKNNREYPIKISANAKNGVASISIMGIKQEKEYDIEITSSVLSYTPYQTTYEENSSMEEGKEKVIQKGHTGMKSVANKIVKEKGKIISKTVLSNDTYQPMNRIVQVGTKATQKEETKPAKTENVEDSNPIEEETIQETEID